jgi:hypothetical protein
MILTSQTRNPLKVSIARLSDPEIRSMDRDDLLDLIRISRDVKSLRAIQECGDDVLLEWALIERDKCRELCGCQPRYERRPSFKA